MPTDINVENILADFAMEDSLTPDVLRTYIQQYPKFAVEITDLFHDLTMVDLSTSVESIPIEAELTAELLTEGVGAVRTALSGIGLRDLARRIELPRDFISGFRDRKIRLGSVPANILINLARAIDVKVQYFIAYLQVQRETGGAVAFKADGKPRAPSVMEYNEFIESLRLNDIEVAALERLAGSDGPN